MAQSVVLGVDAGGSYTRVACARLDGVVLGVGRAGGGSPTHNADPAEQVQRAIGDALDRAGASPLDVVGLWAGLAGFDRERDRRWADGFFDIPGLDCPREMANDTVVAHAGAFAGGPGVIVVAGTGSMILAITESGELVRNDLYHHYAGGARHLSFDAMARILIGDDELDDAFGAAVLEYWGAADRAGLRRRVQELEARDPNEVKRFYGAMAPLVTAAAEDSSLAGAACDWLVGASSVGVRLLGAHFVGGPVMVSTTGGVGSTSAFARRLGAVMTTADPSRFELVSARLEPVGGAVLLALRDVGMDPGVHAEVARTLRV